MSAQQAPFFLKERIFLSVHKAISNHVNKQNAILKKYSSLDLQREQLIEEALHLCSRGLPYQTDMINTVTAEMNTLSKKIENLETRKYVTNEMIADYVHKTKN